MSIKEIDRIRGSANAIEAYRAGMNMLFQSGIIDAVRVLGRARIIGVGGDTVNTMAIEGARSAGWNDCLETLLYFQERYLDITNETPNVQMSFGSIDRAVSAGDLTEEEANAIRNGKSVAYKPSAYTRNIDNPTRS